MRLCSKCQQWNAVITSAGLCQRCDMHRRIALPPGCPPIPGEYVCIASVVYPIHSGGGAYPPLDDPGGFWDNLIRTLEEDR